MKKSKQIIYWLLAFLPILGHAQTWEIPSTGPDGNPDIMVVYKNKLIIAGGFFTCGGLPLQFIASWDGFQWAAVGSNLVYARHSFEVIGNELYMSFGGIQPLYKWNGTNYNAVGTESFNSIVTAIKFKDNIYAGGNFSDVGGKLRKSMARLNSINKWDDVGGGMERCIGGFTHVNSLEVYKNELYAGGFFCQAGGRWARSIARWNGTQWDSVGTGLGWTGYIADMEVDTINDFLYIAGAFSTAGGVPAKCIARWDGFKWESVNYPIYDNVLALKFYHHELYIGANSKHGFITDTCFSKFDGKNWHFILGPNSTIMCMEVYQDKLYIGGGMTLIDTVPTHYFAAYSAPPPTHCNWLISRIYANKDTFYLGDTINFENNNKYATSWAWDFGDGGIDSVQKPNYIYQNSGVYTASVIVHQENCYDTAYFTVNVQQVDAINNTKQKEYMLCNNIPNPFTNSTIIPYQIPQGKQGFIIITDINSKEIARYALKEAKGNLEVSTEGWKAGIYYYSLLLNSIKVESKQMVITW